MLSLLIASALASCSQIQGEGALKRTDSQQLTEAKQLLLANAPTGTRILAMCGASYGRAVYIDEKGLKWEPDQISKGTFAFVQKPDGKVDYLFRDATGELTSATQDEGVVSKITDGGRNDPTFVVVYPGTGIIETYNLTEDPKGGRLALWTTNKPVNRASAKVGAFLASCL